MKITLTNGYTGLDTEKKHWWVCGSDGGKGEWERYWKVDGEKSRMDGNVVNEAQKRDGGQ